MLPPVGVHPAVGQGDSVVLVGRIVEGAQYFQKLVPVGRHLQALLGEQILAVEHVVEVVVVGVQPVVVLELTQGARPEIIHADFTDDVGHGEEVAVLGQQDGQIGEENDEVVRLAGLDGGGHLGGRLHHGHGFNLHPHAGFGPVGLGHRFQEGNGVRVRFVVEDANRALAGVYPLRHAGRTQQRRPARGAERVQKPAARHGRAEQWQWTLTSHDSLLACASTF